MPRYEATITCVYRVSRTVQVEAEHKGWARLAAEDPDNWTAPSDEREDFETAELTGINVVELREVKDEGESG